jgi:GTP cyclohydrolase I
MNDEAVEHARALLESLGLDETVDPELRGAPKRFAGLLHDLFAGVRDEPPVLSTFPVEAIPVEATEVAPTDGMKIGSRLDPIILLNIPFRSMCVHHLVPMFGTIDVAYVPHERIIGFGSVGRAIDYVVARPQIQERIVVQVAELLQRNLEPEGLLIRCRARQMCMEMRGAQKQGVLVSSASRGSLRTGDLRQEMMRQFVESDQTL